jgi:hypothetical protein
MVSAKPSPFVLLHNVVLSYLPLNNLFFHDSTLFSKQVGVCVNGKYNAL